MSLTDLKKSKKPTGKKKNFTVDEFISDAENYAKGQPEIVSTDTNAELKEPLTLSQAISEAQKHLARQEQQQKPAKPFRHATFTLSEEAIAQLQLLANESKLAKSHIIRILIAELCNQEQHEQLKKLLSSDTN
ncbi:hypothetical protein [Thalassomonas actiniarum]|uniref:Ribbon-helix-helix protein CopG domain-containing protein n=1 Tax=Thalassomonas actiniarum TaxID=485447 RepID=A0AAF0C1G1_9GAMM|nr:hypothetical protein [Thalassomonas actiniarum]WDD98946.1 hypothetical protein SG35_027605 [Thalassomonas actiniarum]